MTEMKRVKVSAVIGNELWYKLDVIANDPAFTVEQSKRAARLLDRMGGGPSGVSIEASREDAVLLHEEAENAADNIQAHEKDELTDDCRKLVRGLRRFCAMLRERFDLQVADIGWRPRYFKTEGTPIKVVVLKARDRKSGAIHNFDLRNRLHS